MKIERQTKIIELIKEFEIDTQEELALKLNSDGYIVTQATISRDIRELKLTKVSLASGKQKYVVLPEKSGQRTEKFMRVLKDGFLTMDRAGNLIVVKTISGMAMAVAAAIDALNYDEIIGCIAGDDTIFCAIKHEADVTSVMERFFKIVGR